MGDGFHIRLPIGEKQVVTPGRGDRPQQGKGLAGLCPRMGIDPGQGFAKLALNAPSPPVADLTSFENFINSNNLSQPADLYQAYPQTVPKIIQAFKPKHKPA